MSEKKNPGLLFQKITLNDLRFFAYHGFYPEEQVEGNEFFVNITVTFLLTEFLNPESQEDLSTTINYETIYQIAESEMAMPRKLLETVCQNMIQKMLAEFSFAESIEICIRKSKLPFGGADTKATVCLGWHA